MQPLSILYLLSLSLLLTNSLSFSLPPSLPHSPFSLSLSLAPPQRFARASAICGADFLSSLSHIVESDLEALSFVDEAVKGRAEIDPSGEIIKFSSGGMPWKGHLYDLEAKYDIEGKIKFVLYEDQGGMWRVQAVTVKGTAFANRIGLCSAWRGVRDSDLVGVSGIEGAKFAHAAGFIGGAKTFEAALQMAKLSIKEGKP